MEPLSRQGDAEPIPPSTQCIVYGELEVGDRFVFVYPHHGEQLWAWLYVRAEQGHHRIDKSEINSPIAKNIPLMVKRVPDGVVYENGMILLEDIE